MEEPKEGWEKSEAKKALERAILDGEIPLHARDENGRSTMALKLIYNSIPELAPWDYKKLSRRLGSLRKTIRNNQKRRDDDRKAYDRFISRHQPSQFNKFGFVQYEGSSIQEQLRSDIADSKHETMAKLDLFRSNELYYGNMDLKTFRDRISQEINTAKYLNGLRVRGKVHKAS